MLRHPGFSALAALALGLVALPAEGQAGSPVLASANGEWDPYLSTSAPTSETVAEPGLGADVWYWAGIGAATFGVGGAFTYYVKHDFFARPPAATRGSSTPAGPAIRDPGPVVTKPSQTGDPDPPSNAPKDGGGAVQDSSSTNPTDPPADTQPGGDEFSEPPPPKTVPVPPPADEGDTPTTVTPEPPTLVLLMSGILAFLFLQRRRGRA
jgi:hypothetical protein